MKYFFVMFEVFFFIGIYTTCESRESEYNNQKHWKHGIYLYGNIKMSL